MRVSVFPLYASSVHDKRKEQNFRGTMGYIFRNGGHKTLNLECTLTVLGNYGIEGGGTGPAVGRTWYRWLISTPTDH